MGDAGLVPAEPPLSDVPRFEQRLEQLLEALTAAADASDS
jgi:hypothetical protein